ncbi:MAG: PilZ domain-containing protein [Candidatus Omnitrophica bacterium]|nr:PilZ domain-containing protein [Candidatus Omnitrophota bacterium]
MEREGGIERRKHPRVKKRLPLKLHDEVFDIVTQTENISCSGAYCEVNRFLAPMTKLNVVMLLPMEHKGKKAVKKIECKGVVVRTEQPQLTEGSQIYKIAIFFNQINKSDMKKIAEYVSYHLSKDKE